MSGKLRLNLKTLAAYLEDEKKAEKNKEKDPLSVL